MKNSKRNKEKKMKFALIFVALCLGSVLALEDLSKEQWAIFKKVHGKKYESLGEDSAR